MILAGMIAIIIMMQKNVQKENKSKDVGLLKEEFVEIYTPDGKKVVDFNHLPGEDGFQIPRRLTADEMVYLTEEYGVEFAQVYHLGPGKNGGGGVYILYSGDVGSVSIKPSLRSDAIIYKSYTSRRYG